MSHVANVRELSESVLALRRLRNSGVKMKVSLNTPSGSRPDPLIRSIPSLKLRVDLNSVAEATPLRVSKASFLNTLSSAVSGSLMVEALNELSDDLLNKMIDITERHLDTETFLAEKELRMAEDILSEIRKGELL